MAVDRRWVLAAGSPLRIVVLSVAAAMGLFASLGFHDHAHGSDVERDPASPRRWIDAYAASRAPENRQ